MGPGDPLIPRQYGGLVEGGHDHCDDLRRGPDGDVAGSFWDIARQVCSAVRSGGRWPDVAVAPAPPTADGPFAKCLDDEVRHVLDALLAWRQQHPGLEPEVRFAEPGALSACERSMYSVRAVLVGEQDFEGGDVGDVRIEFEVPSRPDFDGDNAVALVDGEVVPLSLDGVEPNRGTRAGRIILGPDWADGREAALVIRAPNVERSASVVLPHGEAGPGPSIAGSTPSTPETTT